MKVLEIPLKLIDPQPNPIREIDGQVINDLRESIKQHGVLQPILVRFKQPSKRYEIVFGNHRYYACKGAGLKTIPAIITEMPDSKALLTSVTENIQRLEMNPVKEGEAYSKLLNYYDYKVLSERVGKSVTYLKGRVSLYKKLHTDLKRELGKNLTMSSAIQISKIPLSKQKIVFEEIQRAKNSLEKQYKGATTDLLGGGAHAWSPYCKCPKCGSVHEKGADYKHDEKS